MEIDHDDFASMLAAVRGELDDRQLAFALDVTPRELDELAAGRFPEAETAERLRALYDLSGRADVTDPRAVARALGVPTDTAAALPLAAAALLLRRRTVIIAFIALDVLVVGGLLLVTTLLR